MRWFLGDNYWISWAIYIFYNKFRIFFVVNSFTENFKIFREFLKKNLNRMSRGELARTLLNLTSIQSENKLIKGDDKKFLFFFFFKFLFLDFWIKFFSKKWTLHTDIFAIKYQNFYGIFNLKRFPKIQKKYDFKTKKVMTPFFKIFKKFYFAFRT